MRSIPARLAPIAVASVAVLGSACGGSGYQYVKNDELGIYAKLPDDWTVYDEEDLFPDASQTELDREAEVRWIRTFDERGRAQRGHDEPARRLGPGGPGRAQPPEHGAAREPRPRHAPRAGRPGP